MMTYGYDATIGRTRFSVKGAASMREAQEIVLNAFIDEGLWAPPYGRVKWWHFWWWGDPLLKVWEKYHEP